MTHKYLEYVDDVLSNKIVTGNNIKKACERFKNDMQRDDLYFDYDKVDKAISFISTLKHYKGEHAGTSFTLQGWQQFIVANVVGFYYSENNLRRFTSSYIEVTRKNGKTALAAALCLYFLVADGEAGAEVLLAANSKEQAKVCFEMCSKFSKTIDAKGKYFKCYRGDIIFDTTDSKLKVLAADDSKLDGFNCSFGLIDEYHAAKNSGVRDVIKSSMGMRKNPHIMTITTAGKDKSVPCYKLRETAIEIVNGIKKDDSIFVAVYNLDEKDDWQNEAVWAKATPNLGVTVQMRNLREYVVQAINNPSEAHETKTKQFNMWCDTENIWIADDYLLPLMRDVDLLDKKFKECICYVGVDLASVSDLTAVSFMIIHEDKYYFKTHYYIPESAYKKLAANSVYSIYKAQGKLTVTSGDVTDYDYITNDLMRYSEHLLISKIGYDKYNATQWAIDATSLGLPLEEYSQSLGNFNMPTRELERQILSGNVIIDTNEITLNCFRNVKLKYDHNGNCKPDKGLGISKKIDGVISMIQALGVYLVTPQYGFSI